MRNFLLGIFYMWTAMVLLALSFVFFPIVYSTLLKVDGDNWYTMIIAVILLITGIIWSAIIGYRGTLTLIAKDKKGGVFNSPRFTPNQS